METIIYVIDQVKEKSNMSTVRDSQKSKVYKWEFTVRKLDSNLNEQLTLPQAQELSDKAWQRYYPNKQ